MHRTVYSSTCKTTTPSRPSWTTTNPMLSFTAQPSEDRTLSKRCVAVSQSTISGMLPSDLPRF